MRALASLEAAEKDTDADEIEQACNEAQSVGNGHAKYIPNRNTGGRIFKEFFAKVFNLCARRRRGRGPSGGTAAIQGPRRGGDGRTN